MACRSGRESGGLWGLWCYFCNVAARVRHWAWSVGRAPDSPAASLRGSLAGCVGRRTVAGPPRPGPKYRGDANTPLGRPCPRMFLGPASRERPWAHPDCGVMAGRDGEAEAERRDLAFRGDRHCGRGVRGGGQAGASYGGTRCWAEGRPEGGRAGCIEASAVPSPKATGWRSALLAGSRSICQMPTLRPAFRFPRPPGQ